MRDRDQILLQEAYELICENELAARTGHLGFTGKVWVYKNLNLSAKLGYPIFSIMDIATNKVIGHERNLMLRDCILKVRQGGMEKVRQEQRKNVHAGVIGYLTNEEPRVLPTQITYNPYKYTSFVDKSNESPVHSAKLVSLIDGKVSADGIK
jgi:hypothetical protein